MERGTGVILTIKNTRLYFMNSIFLHVFFIQFYFFNLHPLPLSFFIYLIHCYLNLSSQLYFSISTTFYLSIHLHRLIYILLVSIGQEFVLNIYNTLRDVILRHTISQSIYKPHPYPSCPIHSHIHFKVINPVLSIHSPPLSFPFLKLP